MNKQQYILFQYKKKNPFDHNDPPQRIYEWDEVSKIYPLLGESDYEESDSD